MDRWTCPGSSWSNACDKGYYCPTPEERLICPKDHYCREGTINPRECSALAVCGEGTSAAVQSFHGLIAIIVCALVGLGGIMLYENRVRIIESMVSLFNCTWLARPGSAADDAVIDADNDDADLLDLASIEDMRQQSNASQGGQQTPIIPKDFTITFKFNDLGLQLGKKSKKGPMILQGVTGSLKSHRVTAVMGQPISNYDIAPPFFFKDPTSSSTTIKGDQNGLQAKSGFEMCFDNGSQHLGCWGHNTSRTQNKKVYATL